MIRRLTSIVAVVVALPLAFVTAPIWIVIAVAADIVGRLWRFPTLRLCLFAVVYLGHQWAGLGRAVLLIIAERVNGKSKLLQWRQTQAWWASSLLRWSRRLLGVNFNLDDLNTLPDKPFVILSRHASMVDAVLPVVLVTEHLQRYVHYVLKDELLWDPAIATYGSRLGNWFVSRGSRTEDDLEGIADMAANAQPDSALVIFPEGTYATPANRRRVLDSLTRKVDTNDLDARVLDYAKGLSHLLPPKPAGTLTMLSSRPDADVVVLGHVGLEGVSELRGLRRRLPLSHPVTLRWWIHRRAELPTDQEKLEYWLQQRWVELDSWVADTIPTRARS